MPLQHVGGLTTAQLRDKVASLGGSSFRGELGAAMAATAHRELLRGFQLSRDPYGKPWEPVGRLQKIRMKRGQQGPRVRRGKPLIKSGNLRAGAVAEATSDGFRIGLPASYAAVHQKGSKKTRGRGSGIRRRQMIPERETGGLGLWQAPLDETAKKVLDRWGRR